MKLDVDICEQTLPDNLPNKTEDEMFSALRKVRRADVHHGATNTLRGRNDDVVVLRNLERIQRFVGVRLVQDTSIDGVRYGGGLSSASEILRGYDPTRLSESVGS